MTWPMFRTQSERCFFFEDEAEIRELFMKYVKPNRASKALVVTTVPGDERKHTTRTDRVRRGTLALVVWSIALNDCGYCLDGRFSGDDFGVDLSGALKGRKTLIPLLKKVTGDEMLKNQMMNVADVVEMDIHSIHPESDTPQLDTPKDLVHLLEQLRENHTACPLIINHGSHKDDDSKSVLFVKMYTSLRAMKGRNPTVYKSIIDHIGGLDDVQGWIRRAMNNVHLHTMLRYRPGTPPPATLEDAITKFLESGVRYKEDAQSLLEFRRNGNAHLEMDYSVEKIKYLEAGLFAASEGFNFYYRHEHQKLQLQQQQQTESLHEEQELDKQEMQHKHAHELNEIRQRLLEQQGWEQQGRRRRLQQHEQQKELQRQLNLKPGEHQELWRQMEVEHEKESKKLQQKHKEEQEDLLLLPLRPERSGAMILAIIDFLATEGAKLSKPAAMAGARAAVVYMATANLTEAVEESAQTASESASVTLAKAALPLVPSNMFASDDINRMHDMVCPNVLVCLQKVMFEKGECFRLGNDTMVPKLD